MPSPFPGMNPYLEQSYDWQDFHTEFNTAMRRALSREVGPNYFVKVEVRLVLHKLSASERRFVGTADIGVGNRREQLTSVGTATVAAPIRLQLPALEYEKERYLEILDLKDRRVVTVIELLSPSNKRAGSDRKKYLAKRKQMLRSKVNFVEIDLRRGGKRPSSPDLPPCDYYVLVSRHEDRPMIDCWPFGIRDSLPVIPIPLASPDLPVMLDLKKVLDQTYDDADYGKYIYLEAPEPPLSPEDDAWARGIAGLST